MPYKLSEDQSLPCDPSFLPLDTVDVPLDTVDIPLDLLGPQKSPLAPTPPPTQLIPIECLPSSVIAQVETATSHAEISLFPSEPVLFCDFCCCQSQTDLSLKIQAKQFHREDNDQGY